MWMSKKISHSVKNDSAEKGRVTLSNKQIEAGATVTRRNIDCYTPYGFNSLPPVDEQVIMVPSSDGTVVLGTLNNPENIESGEVELRSLGGAYILLKNNGDVVINGLVINRQGVIENE